MSVFALTLAAAAALVLILMAILVLTVRRLQERLAATEAARSALTGRLAAEEARATEQTAGLAALAVRLDRSESTAASDLNRFIHRAARLEAQAAEHASDLAGLLARQERAADEHGANRRRLDQRADRLDATTSEQATAIADLLERHQGAEKTQSDDRGRVQELTAGLEVRLSEHRDDIDRLRSRMIEADAQRETEQARAAGRIEALESRVSKQADAGRSLGDRLDSAQTRLGEHGSALDAVHRRLGDVDGSVQGAQARLGDLQRSGERLAFRVAGVAARLSLALADARARSEALAKAMHDIADQRDRESLFEERIGLAEQRLHEQTDWLSASHEPWLQRHDEALAELDARLRGADDVAHEQVSRFAAVDAAVRETADAIQAHEAWLGGSHEPWLSRHDQALFEIEDRLRDTQGLLEQQRSLLAAADPTVLAGEVIARTHAELLGRAQEPWSLRHDRDMTDHEERLEQLEFRIRDAEEQTATHRNALYSAHEPWLHRLNETVSDLQARPQAPAAPASERSAVVDLFLQRLADLAEQVSRHEQQIAACIGWLGGSHEPWLTRHDGFINRLLIDLPAYVGTVDQLLAASWQVQTQLLDVLAGGETPTTTLEAPRRAIVDLKLRRRDARQRGLLPNGEPGPCEGIRLARGRRPILVVAFSGMHDVFGWLPRLESLEVSCVHVVDTTETWYLDGCDGARSIDLMMDAIRAAISGLDYERMVVIGQSMGGYAALRFGPELGADLIAVFGPQTYRLTKSSLNYGEFLIVPEGAVDVRPSLLASGVQTRVFVSRSERDAPYVWDDHAHLEGLKGAPTVHVHVAACDDHGVAGHISQTGMMNRVLESLFSLAEGEPPLVDLDAL